MDIQNASVYKDINSRFQAVEISRHVPRESGQNRLMSLFFRLYRFNSIVGVPMAKARRNRSRGSQSPSPISVEVIVFDSYKPGIVNPILVVNWSPNTPNIARMLATI